MSLRKPPALATWLLHRLRVPETNAALTGDIFEEFQSGRSSTWYWRQTVAGIAAGLHSRLPRILIGWTRQASIALAFWRFYSPLPLRVLIPVTLIALSNFIIVGMALGDRGRKKLAHALFPHGRVDLRPLGMVMGLIIGEEGRMPWSEFAVIESLWLAGVILFAMRPPRGKTA